MENNKLNLRDTEKIPIETAEFVRTLGKVLVVAPHADDESLGCGGAIALMRKFDVEVSILLLTDGTLSHPNSKKFPKEKLRRLREDEFCRAAEILGIKNEKIYFFRLSDRNLPPPDTESFSAVVSRSRKILQAENPQTIFLPWRRDPHPDHRAAFLIFDAANTEKRRIIEYPIWFYELAESADAPLKSEVSAFRLDISETLAIKRKAIRAHVSQISDLIDDDPHGFRLSDEVLSNFDEPFELYFRSDKN